MADVANCMNASTPTKVHMGQIISESPESVVLSPGVKEAMDRIFPRSATQLLQGGLSFGEDSLFSVSSLRTSKETMQTKSPVISTSCIDMATSHGRSSHITTLATSDTAMAASLGFTSATRIDSNFVNSSPILTTSSPHSSSPGALNFESNKDSVESVSKTVDLQKNIQSKIRISKADFEIVTSCDALISEYERTTRRVNCTDVSSSECHSRDESDSEDMRRPFATIAREKKRRKRKKKQTDCGTDKAGSLLFEHSVNSADEFQTSKSWNTKSVSVRDSDNGKIVSQPDFVSRTNTVIKNTLEFSENNGSHSDLGSVSAKDAFYKDYGITSDDISNISYSSSKENAHAQKKVCRQKLPKTKRQHYHIVKHVNKIKNTFPPCFVVVEKTDNLNFSAATKYFNVSESALPLSVRVKKLADLCDKGTLWCRKNRNYATEELVYKNIFTETPYLGIADDDNFEKPRVRSLRKRDKNISYVEPSEDDILVEFSRKHSRTKNNDFQFVKSSDESSSDSKKRKKQDASKKNSVAAVSLSGSKDKVPVTDASRTDFEMDKRVLGSDGQREVIIYPHTNLNNAHPYYSRTEGTGMIPLNVQEKPQHILYPQDPGKNISMMPSAPPHISILSNSSMPGAFPHHPTPVSLFPSLPPNFQGLPPPLPPPPPPLFLGGAPSSCQVSTSSGPQGPHQFYIVKMNGKDVILRFVPSAGIGMQQPMVLPKGTSHYAPSGPAHIISQPVGQPHQSSMCAQAMLSPVTSLAPAAHNNTAPSSSLQSLYGMPMLNRPGHTSSHNISMTTLPVVPPAHLGYGNSIGMRPISLTPGTHASHGSAAPAPAHLAGHHVSNAAIRPVSLTSGTYVSHSTAASLSVPVPAPLAPAPSHLQGRVSTTGIRPVSLTVPATSHNNVTGLSGYVFPPKTSGTSTTVKSVVSSTISTQSSPALASVSSPNTTTLVRSVHATGSSLQETPSSQSATVRIFVPGCSTTGTPGRFATLKSLVNNSPLTRLSANSSLLPQCKRNSDNDLSPEQHAAKRRKLEKKYPLPPGVVIKTEPLDTPQKPAAVITSRSLLTSNLQLLPASRPGSNVQRFQIINPNWATALSLRNVSGSSDVVYRTASVGGGQTVLVPTSLGPTSTTTASTPPSLTSSSSSDSLSSTLQSAASHVAVSSINLNPLCNDITSLNTETFSQPHVQASGSPQLLAQHQQKGPIYNSACTSTIYPDTISTSQPFVAPSSCVHNSLEPTVSVNGPAKSSSEPLTSSNVSTSLWSNEHTHLPPTKATSVAACPENISTGLEELRKMIQVQESRGLKGERLIKLKELLQRKEQYYNNLQRLGDIRAPSATEYYDSHTLFYNDGNREIVDNVCENGTSETNPFVID